MRWLVGEVKEWNRGREGKREMVEVCEADGPVGGEVGEWERGEGERER